MECLIGIRGKDFVLLASDTVAGRSIMAMKHGECLFTSHTDLLVYILLAVDSTGHDDSDDLHLLACKQCCGCESFYTMVDLCNTRA